MKLLILFALWAAASFAQATNVLPYQFKNLSIEDYQLGTKRYLVYMEDKATGKIRTSDLWERTTSVTTIDGKKYIKISQNWRGPNEKMNRKIESVNEVSSFAPISHWTLNAGTNKEAFIFTKSKTIGDKSVDGNRQRDFEVNSQLDTLNWELDMETFELLEYSLGKVFKLNFYHPGSKTPPKYYEYHVTGEEKLRTANGDAIDCWTLKIDYGKGNYATFWIEKQRRQLFKMKESWGNMNRYKIRLAV